MQEAASVVEVHLLTEEQAELVRETLHSMVTSPLFAKSKRYPALLEYLVLHALDGGECALKERMIGTDVFGRPATYEPGTDPIVRVAAGEVRRRIDVYYSKHPDAQVRIEFPSGQYNALFHFRSARTTSSPAFGPILPARQLVETSSTHTLVEATALPTQLHGVRWRRWPMVASAVAVALALLAATGITAWRSRQARPRNLLSSVLSAAGPTLIVLGERAQASLPQPSGVQSAGESLAGESPAGGNPIPGTSIANATTAVLICDDFRNYGRTCDLLPATHSHLTNLQKKTVVFIGSDNDWTRRILTPLRFRFNPRVSTDTTTTDSISDYGVSSGRPAVWTNTPLGTNYTDYAVVATFHSDITDGTAVVEAGLTANGTLGAAQFMSDTESGRQLYARGPKGWKGLNFEAVLQIDVVQGAPGHAKILAAQFW